MDPNSQLNDFEKKFTQFNKQVDDTFSEDEIIRQSSSTSTTLSDSIAEQMLGKQTPTTSLKPTSQSEINKNLSTLKRIDKKLPNPLRIATEFYHSIKHDLATFAGAILYGSAVAVGAVLSAAICIALIPAWLTYGAGKLVDKLLKHFNMTPVGLEGVFSKLGLVPTSPLLLVMAASWIPRAILLIPSTVGVALLKFGLELDEKGEQKLERFSHFAIALEVELFAETLPRTDMETKMLERKGPLQLAKQGLTNFFKAKSQQIKEKASEITEKKDNVKQFDGLQTPNFFKQINEENL